jgi:histidine ammonia-lyase
MENTRRVLSMELLAATTGLEFHRPLRSSAKIEATIRKIRRVVKPIKRDRTFYLDMNAIEALLIEREIDAEV